MTEQKHQQSGVKKLSEQEKKELVQKMGEIIYRRTQELKEGMQEEKQ